MGRPKATLTGKKNLDQLFYTIDETAKIFKVHPNTIRRCIKSGELPAEKLGRQWRIRRTTLENINRK